MREKIFERFIRITSNDINTYPGIGLGLFIAHEMVERQGGNLLSIAGPPQDTRAM